jgi:ABC-2 type transport system ATP-binding protein
MSGGAGHSQAGASGGKPADWGCQRIAVRYGNFAALVDASLGAAAGEVTAVVGADGAGKSTLLRCLAGAIAPAGGQVRRPDASRIGYMPPDSGVYPDLTVTENLAFRGGGYGMRPAEAMRRAAALLERAGLATAGDRLAGRLSGGMRQRLGVIAALLHQPDLLVLDEPSTGVDPVSRAGLWWLIAGAAAAGAAVVLATSYLDEAARAAAVLALDEGRVLASGTPEEIIAAMPGSILVAPDGGPGGSWPDGSGPGGSGPGGGLRSRAWRRDGAWRVWQPPGLGGGPPGTAIKPDLQDAITVAALARDLAGTCGRAAP